MSLAAPTTVNCTACGAGLDVLGGGRVMVHICPYCGSELDAQDNYKVLARFEGMERPDSPLRIGMTGRIKGVDYTVIGTLEHTERWRGAVYRWIDHQLYSPTHGYAWLTLEDGHPVFTRRYRRPVWISVHRVETAENPPTVRIDGRTYRYFETSTSQISFAEGEFTWVPKLGDRTTTVSAMSGDTMLGFSETGGEREVYRSTLLDHGEVARAFGVDLPAPQGMHPLTPFKPGPHDSFMRNVALACLAACIALAVFFDTRTGRETGEPIVVQATSLPATVPITLPDTPGPVRLTFEGTPHVARPPNSPDSPLWARVAISLQTPEGAPAPGAPSGARVHVGGQREGRGPGDTNHTELVFPPTFSGDYRLQLEVTQEGPTGQYLGQGAGQPGSLLARGRDMVQHVTGTAPFSDGAITIRTHAGMSSGYWLYRLGLVFLLIVLYTAGRPLLHDWRRWRKSDWSSED